jgi:four helix bundle protein
MKVRSYDHLIAWQKAVELVVEIYRASRSFPKEELYGLISQIRRAAVSIPSNIAEGQGRLSTANSSSSWGMRELRCSKWKPN